MRIFYKLMPKYIYLILLIGAVSCKLKFKENDNKDIRISNAHSIVDKLNGCVIKIKDGLFAEHILVELSKSIVLYITDEQCQTCIDTIVEQFARIPNSSTCYQFKVLFSVGSLSNYYCLTKKLHGTNIHAYYIEKEQNPLREFNQIFVFRINEESKIDLILIVDETNMLLENVLRNLQIN